VASYPETSKVTVCHQKIIQGIKLLDAHTHTHTAHWITLAVTLTPSDTFEREHCKGFDTFITL